MKKLTLIDGNSILFRAYYATAYPGATIMQTTTGIYTNAVSGFANLLIKIIEEAPENILIAFDTSKPTKRHEKYEDYKAGRKEMPEELASQIPLVHELISYYGIKTYSKEGYEADDIIGTLAKLASNENIKVEIYSSDQDLLQLVDDNITVNLLKKGMRVVDKFNPKKVMDEYELHHDQMIDLKALMGDTSDNIPGIKGIGPKTATKLLHEYKTLDNILKNKEKIKGRVGELITEKYEDAILSKELATIDVNMPLSFTLKDISPYKINHDKLIELYQKLELKQLIINYRKDQEINIKEEVKEFEFKTLEDEASIKNVLKEDLAIYFELSDPNYHKAELWGVGLSNGDKNYFIDRDLALKSESLINYLKDDKYQKSTFNAKSVKVFLMWQGFDLVNSTFDLLLAAYIIKSQVGREDFTTIAQLFNINDLPYDDEIYGRGAKKALPLLPDDYEGFIARKAFIIKTLEKGILKTLKDNNQLKLLNELEIPLSNVLAKMEFEGVLIDKEELALQTKTLKKEIDRLNKEIIELAGLEFNVDSPKQLGEVLFEKLNLPPSKKTKTGYSTNIEVLNGLVNHHPIINLVIEYRQLTKLYSTYLIGINDALFSDNKVHTIYKQALTVTGRLSSIEPNLQNISVRTEIGRKVRKIFIASNDNYLLSADYSQIELRLLALIANVKALKEAFLNDLDIHTITAQKVFHVDKVDSEQRRRAKAVNFGIIYGISAWSLAEDINTSVNEANNFIERYLEIYPEIKDYMENIVKEAKDLGYVTTILNRRRYIPELKNKVHMVREFGKRTALNAPIQGSAADLIKLAMIKLDEYLTKNNKKSKLIMQVHDELILDVNKDELEELKNELPKIMESALKIDVKIKADTSFGKNWYELS
ncbi:MAG: DNA polymerase I [Acholeplasmataceae bacterium]